MAMEQAMHRRNDCFLSMQVSGVGGAGILSPRRDNVNPAIRSAARIRHGHRHAIPMERRATAAVDCP
jgi:hypothetical protein